MATLPFALLVHPTLPVKSVAELIAYAKAKPGSLNFGSSGGGGGAHLGGEMLKTMAKIDMTHVPYKGAAPALVALLGNEVQFMFVSILTATPLIESNRVRIIAVSGLKRSPSYPNVPAVAETPGLAGFETDLWYGMLAPAATPRPIIHQLNSGLTRVLTMPEVQERIRALGMMPSPSTPEEFDQQIRTDYALWGRVIKQAGVKAE